MLDDNLKGAYFEQDSLSGRTTRRCIAASTRRGCTGGGGTTLVDIEAVGMVRGVSSGTGAHSDELSEEKLDNDDPENGSVLFCGCV